MLLLKLRQLDLRSRAQCMLSPAMAKGQTNDSCIVRHITSSIEIPLYYEHWCLLNLVKLPAGCLGGFMYSQCM